MKQLLIFLLMISALSCSQFDREPVADAGEDIEGYVNFTTVFSAERSYDPDGGSLTYNWVLGAVPEESNISSEDILDYGDGVCAFIPDALGNFSFQLTVTDSEGKSATDSLVVIVVEGAPAGSSIEGLQLNELLMDYPYAVELINTLDQPISLSQYELLFNEGSNEITVPLAGSYSAPASSFMTIFDYSTYGYKIPENEYYESPSSFSSYMYSDFSLTLLFNGKAVDFVQVDSSTYTVPAGMIWSQSVSSDNRDYFVRRTIDAGGDLSTQWEAGIGTLGIDNGSTGDAETEITLW